METNLGSMPLSGTVLNKTNIGLWALEFDEGKEPRLYVDDTMLELIGLTQRPSPEETYVAWAKNVDPAHNDEIELYLEKLKEGISVEILYPWHHPNGEVWMIRCGGLRNYSYTKGIRIEGTHQNVTGIERLKKRSLDDLLAALSDNFLNIYFLNPYTGRFEAFISKTSVYFDENRDFSNADFYTTVAEGFNIVYHDDKQLLNDKFSRERLISLLENNGSDEFIVRWKADGDKLLYMKNKITPFTDSNGQKKLIIGIEDVSAEHEYEQRLSEQFAIVNGLSQDYEYVDCLTLGSDCESDTVYQYYNRFDVLNRLSEWNNTTSLTTRLKIMHDTLVYEPDRNAFLAQTSREKILNSLQKDKAYYVNFRVCLDDIIHFAQIKFTPIKDSDGKIIKLVIAYSNMDEPMRQQKEQHDRLAKALQDAEHASQAKSSFLFNMSHDIRTPMNAIIGFTAIALEHADNPDRVRDSLNKVNVSSKQLLNLINDVLDMARIESGKVVPEFHPISITDIAKELMDMIRETDDKNLNIETDFSSIRHPYVLADELHLNRVLTNILSNSIKYTEKGGTIRYSIIEKPGDNEDYNSYDFVIEDTGIGMSAEFLEHIFDEFERANTSTASGVQGTGLGMAITHELVELMGGTIQIASELNVGTRTTITLSLKSIAAPDKGSEDISLDTSVLTGKKVLLVEDGVLNREIVKDILTEKYDMIVDEAENGEIAVDKFRNALYAGKNAYYDIILMDIQMPVMNGYEATKVIRTLIRDEGTHVPIIAMTANAFEEDKQRALDNGMNAHMAKPLDPYTLGQLMVTFLTR